MQKEPRLSEAKQKLLELQRRGESAASAAPPGSELKRYPRENPLPLSLAHGQVWRLDQTAGELTPLHNESITIHRRGPCDPALLEKSLTEVIRRHEIWRTTFEMDAGHPVQIVHSAAPFKLPVSDLRALSQSDRERRALQVATEDASQPFDLKKGPLLRARLITLEEDEHRLYATAHQAIVDGITVFDVFPFELTAIYESLAAGKAAPLPELEAQYADFACWQRRNLAGKALANQMAYWQKQLAGDLPVLRWPNQGIRPPEQTYRGAMHAFELPKELAQALKDLGRREGATLFMILLTGLVTLLHRYTEQEDIIVGTLAPSGRKQTEFQRSMGYFLNPVALRANLAGNPSFRSLLQQMREVTLGAISNDDVPLELIAEKLAIKTDPGRHSFFTVALSVAPDVPQLPHGWSMTYMDVESGGARWDLYLELSDRAEGLLGRAQYNPDLFTPDTIAQTVDDFRRMLEQISTSQTG
jgi:Condensation domain